MGLYLQRYIDGDCEGVWHELIGLGWTFFGYIASPGGRKKLSRYIRPEDEVESIVQSMGLIPF